MTTLNDVRKSLRDEAAETIRVHIETPWKQVNAWLKEQSQSFAQGYVEAAKRAGAINPREYALALAALSGSSPSTDNPWWQLSISHTSIDFPEEMP